jgi:predicted RNase H-like nuclease (RuvC/YqgF family)
MNPLEKAFNALVTLLCQEASEKEKQIDALKKELDERPTQKMLDDAIARHSEAEHLSLHMGDEVRMLERRVHTLEKQLQDTREANVALVRQNAKKRR